jgi:hypothetical protein
MIAESIPGLLLQATAFLGSPTRSLAAIGSLLFSAFATAFTVSAISFDLDSHPTKRRNNPEFYGYLPDGSRGKSAAFALMFAVHSTLIIGRTLAMALLFLTNWRWMAAYLGGDMGLYLLYKILRNDVYYFPAGLGLGQSVVCRVLAKVLVDYTGVIHFRNPHELGIYWIVNAGMSQVACIVSAVLYSKYYTGAGKIEDSMLFVVVGSLVAAWLASFAAFALIIKRDYLHTFVSMQSGCDYQMSTFRNHEGDDEKRIRILFGNDHKWRAIRREVKEWVLANYDVWIRDRPAWFTDDVKSRIPSDFVPPVKTDIAPTEATPVEAINAEWPNVSFDPH